MLQAALKDAATLDTAAPSEPDADHHRATRRPYCAPRLVRLGSVRELTLGGTAGLAEGAGTFIKAM